MSPDHGSQIEARHPLALVGPEHMFMRRFDPSHEAPVHLIPVRLLPLIVLLGFLTGVLAGGASAQAAPQKTSFEVREASIRDLQKAMEQGTVTSAGLVDAYLARIA